MGGVQTPPPSPSLAPAPVDLGPQGSHMTFLLLSFLIYERRMIGSYCTGLMWGLNSSVPRALAPKGCVDSSRAKDRQASGRERSGGGGRDGNKAKVFRSYL